MKQLDRLATLYDTPIEQIDVPMTIRFTITEGGSHTYTLEQTHRIIAYMREHDCSVEDAIYDLAETVGSDISYPEEYNGFNDVYDCEYDANFTDWDK